MEGGRIVTLTADTVAFIGDLHGDLRALVRVLRHCGCFRAAPDGDGAADGEPGSRTAARAAQQAAERAAWDRLDQLCGACPVGRERQRFPEPERLAAIRHMGGVRDGRAVVFCGDVIDNRRPGVTDGEDQGFGICAYADSVELVVETVARLCRDSPRGAVTWLLGNHDVWPFLPSCRTCNQYGPVHTCEPDGSYTEAFRRFLIDHLIAARAQACVVANGVFACHGGLSGSFARQAVADARVAPGPDVPPLTALVRTINLAFDELLHAAAQSHDAMLPAQLERAAFGWCLAPDALLWCRPQVEPLAFEAVFEPATFAGADPAWRGLAEQLSQLSYCVAHTMQRHGVTIARAGQGGSAAPKLMRQGATTRLKPRSLLSVDTGSSRAFGRANRIVQVTRVADNGHVHVSRNLV